MYLNASTNDDAHEEVGDNTSNSHHQALNDSDTCIKAQDKEEIVPKARVKSNHEVTNGSRQKSYQYQKWHC